MITLITDLSNAFGVVLVELIWKVVVTWHAHNSVCKLIKYIQVSGQCTNKKSDLDLPFV